MNEEILTPYQLAYRIASYFVGESVNECVNLTPKIAEFIARRDKAIAAEAVAKEAARWRVKIFESRDALQMLSSSDCTHRNKCVCDLIGDLTRLILSDGSDYLAKHDAEVVKLWREKVGEALLLLGAYDITSEFHSKAGQARNILAALLSPNPISEDK